MSDTLSLGGSLTALSPERSPWVGLALAEEVVLDADPNRPAMGGVVCGVVERSSREVVDLTGLS